MGNGYGKRERALKRRVKDAEAGQRSALHQAREASNALTEVGRIMGIRGIVEPQNVADVATDLVRALRSREGSSVVTVAEEAPREVRHDEQWAREVALEGWRALEREVNEVFVPDVWSNDLADSIRAHIEQRLEEVRRYGFVLRAGGAFAVLWEEKTRTVKVLPRDPVLAETGATVDARVRSLEANVAGHERQISRMAGIVGKAFRSVGSPGVEAQLYALYSSGSEFEEEEEDVVDDAILDATEIRPGTFVMGSADLRDLMYVLDGVRRRFGDDTVARAAEDRIRRKLQRGGFIA